jgi:hypothetical protein
MARTNIQVVITVKDGATKPLDNVQKGIRNTGKAAKDSTADIWQFNKTLFSTFAFIGLFAKGFSKLKESLMIGAELDKVSTQFERQVGPKSKFIQALEGSTNVVVDEMTAMKSGLQLSNLGITHSLEDTADTIAKFAVAGRMAGKDSTEVIEGLTQAVTDGNVAKLEELGIMRRSDPAFMALQAVTAKAGGTMGGVIAKQQAMAVVMGAINKRVQGQMFAFMSLGEVIDYTGKAYNNLTRNIGVLLGNAVRPLLEKLLPLIQSFNKIVDNITRTDKETVFLVKTILALAGAFSAVFASLGTMKLLVKLLGFTPLGFPGMATAILAVTAAFVGLSAKAEGPLAKLRIFGAFFKGIYELVSNFDPETGMSKISAATQKLLADNGILGFVDFIAAAIVTVKTTVKDIADFISWAAVKVDNVVGKLFGTMNDGLKGVKKWTTWWTTNTLSDFDKVKRAALILGGVLGGIFLGKKLFGMAGGLLSKIPIIGGMFGGGKGSGPTGSATDPIYTIAAGSILSKIPGVEGFFKPLLEKLGAKVQDFILKSSFLAEIFTNPKGKIFGLGTAIYEALKGGASLLYGGITSAMEAGSSLLIRALGPALGPVAAVVAAGAVGYAIGTLIDKFGPTFMGKTDEGFEGGLLERMFFKLDNLVGGETSANFIKNQNKLNELNSRDTGGKQTAVSVPTTPDEQEAIIQTLGEQMKSMNVADRANMQEAVQNALKADSSGGSLISPEEFMNFQNMLTKAFDESKNLQELVNETKRRQTSLRAGQRG